MDDLDNEPTAEELSKAITAMAPWKAPDSDGIPADLLQHCKSCLLPLLHDILVKCWREGMMPQDICDANIKGTRSDCNKQGCVLATNLFGIFFSMLIKRAFRSTFFGIKPHTKTDGNLYNLARLRAKRKVKNFTV